MIICDRPVMVIRLRCRRIWVSALLRVLRNGVMPRRLRRHLIVVDQPRVLSFPAPIEIDRSEAA